MEFSPVTVKEGLYFGHLPENKIDADVKWKAYIRSNTEDTEKWSATCAAVESIWLLLSFFIFINYKLDQILGMTDISELEFPTYTSQHSQLKSIVRLSVRWLGFQSYIPFLPSRNVANLPFLNRYYPSRWLISCWEILI